MSWIFNISLFSGHDRKKKLNVRFFNDNGRFGLISFKNVIEFNGEDHFWNKVKELKLRKKPPKFAGGALRAIAEAEFFRKYPHANKILLFEEIVCGLKEPLT